MICYFCGQYGHSRTECPKAEKCYNCNQRGHFASSCYSSSSNRSSNSYNSYSLNSYSNRSNLNMFSPLIQQNRSLNSLSLQNNQNVYNITPLSTNNTISSLTTPTQSKKSTHHKFENQCIQEIYDALSPRTQNSNLKEFILQDKEVTSQQLESQNSSKSAKTQHSESQNQPKTKKIKKQKEIMKINEDEDDSFLQIESQSINKQKYQRKKNKKLDETNQETNEYSNVKEEQNNNNNNNNNNIEGGFNVLKFIDDYFVRILNKA